MTQETTPEDSMCNGAVRSMQSLSPSVRPSANGCRATKEATDASSVVTQA
ncbi:MAG: hypothetical protein QM665_02685 [Desulfovibrio sp.]